MISARYRVKECNIHFGFDDVLNFPEYILCHTMIVGNEHFVNKMVTNIISELILEYTSNDILLSIWDASKLYFDKRTAKDISKIDCVKFSGDEPSDYLATFMLDVERWLKEREEMYIDEQCSTIYDYERMCYESVPYHIVVINNWEERLVVNNDICEDAFYGSMRKLLSKAADSKTFVLLASSGQHKLPNDIQTRFQYIVHDGNRSNVLAQRISEKLPNSLGKDSAVIRLCGHGYDILRVPDFYDSIKEILDRKKYPCGVLWDKDRLEELKKLYDMEGES